MAGTALTIVALLVYVTLPDGTALQEQRAAVLEPVSTRELATAFDRLDYDLGAVRAGRLAVPRLYVRRLPDDLSVVSDAGLRKSAFLRSLLPLVLMANDELASKRHRVVWLRNKAARRQALTDAEQSWLAETVQLYGAGEDSNLLDHLDLLPTALVLAQAIQDSDWGQSRRALEGNALFGQRTWEGQPSELGSQNAAAEEAIPVRDFDDLMASIRAHMHRLNSDPAYERFRAFRAARRRQGLDVRGEDLLAGLGGLSEQAVLYRDQLAAVIRNNRLGDFHAARLAPMEHGGRDALAALWKESPPPVVPPED